MMLVLVECLFWIIKKATEPKLVLANLSFSQFTSESLLLLCCMRLKISVFTVNKGNGDKW